MDTDASGVRWEDSSSLDQFLKILEAHNFRIFNIPGCSDLGDQFVQFKEKLPLDPPLSGFVNWNSFADSLWAGIDQLPHNRVAVIWENATLLKMHSPESIDIATDIFLSISTDLAAGKYGAKSRKQVLFVMT